VRPLRGPVLSQQNACTGLKDEHNREMKTVKLSAIGGSGTATLAAAFVARLAHTPFFRVGRPLARPIRLRGQAARARKSKAAKRPGSGLNKAAEFHSSRLAAFAA
jgi:hypothetical protein